ncbi:MAG: PAC2 family protein [Micrococcaceae bacterium]
MGMNELSTLFYLDDNYKSYLPDTMPEKMSLIYLIDGFGEAGDVANVVSETMLSTLKHEFIGEFIMDDLVNYRDRRPKIIYTNNSLRNFSAPSLELYLVFDDAGIPFYLLTGQEPDFKWEQFCEVVIDLVDLLNIDHVTWLHSIPMPVPHTRPVGSYIHGNANLEVSDKAGARWSPTVVVPSSAAHLLELRLTEASVKVTGFALHVPHYIAENAYTPAAVSGFDILSSVTGLMFNTDRLRDRARDMEQQINEQINESDEISRVVQALEDNYDKLSDDGQIHSFHYLSEETLPSADEIIAELERYLDHRDKD